MSLLPDYIAVADLIHISDNSGARPIEVFWKDGDSMMILKEPSSIEWVEQHILKNYPDCIRCL